MDSHLVSKTQTIANQRFITSYSYDEHDRMTSKTYPSGKNVGYVYDDKGELMSLNIDGVPFISDIKTNDNGLLSYTYADGTKHTRTYDKNGRVKELSYPNYTEKVNYNKVSNITNIQSDAISREFGYDNLDRLTSYEHNATDFQNFAYDANGNRLNQDQENNETKVFTYALNSNILNSIEETKGTDTKEISYEYDATGNIIKDDKHTYSYGGRNRLTAIDNNVTYQYNYDNKRVSKTVNGVKTYFIYDGHMLIGEYQLNLSDQSRQEMVYLNSTPIATVTPKGTYRIYSDHLDTSRRVATNDEEAKVLWEWESKPFGESLANEDVDQNGKAFTLNLRFPGQYFDSETKTHYNINRDYNPVTGRYIQSDPVGFDGGVNGFGYVGGKPIIAVDEEGLRPKSNMFWTMYLNYDMFSGSDVWEIVGGNIGGTYGPNSNSCATRVSFGLNYSGDPIPSTSGSNKNYNGDFKRYIISARMMKKYLRNYWGRPDKVLRQYTDVEKLQKSLTEGQVAVVASTGHASVVTHSYTDPYVTHYLGDVWLLPKGW